MTISDPLGDMLTRIRNGQRAGLSSVVSPASNLRTNVLEVLKREGYIRGYSGHTDELGHPEIKIELKYHDGQPVIRKIARVSKPGRRVYSKIRDSTPRGVMSDGEARAQNVGGEVLCRVF
jgi:small subunit ribosomal protein S8